jgi:putative transposon-encoded protein
MNKNNNKDYVQKHTFILEGCEVLERNVKAQGTGAHIGVPKRLIGARVAIIILEPPR